MSPMEARVAAAECCPFVVASASGDERFYCPLGEQLRREIDPAEGVQLALEALMYAPGARCDRKTAERLLRERLCKTHLAQADRLLPPS